MLPVKFRPGRARLLHEPELDGIAADCEQDRLAGRGLHGADGGPARRDEIGRHGQDLGQHRLDPGGSPGA